MKITIFCLLIFSFFFSCSNTKIIKQYDRNSPTFSEFNYLAQHRTGNIVLRSGEVIKADSISLEENNIIFNYIDCDTVNLISPDEVEYIYFNDHFVGGSKGIFLGALGGAIVSLAVVDRDAEMAGLVASIIIAKGSVAGLIAGGIIGNKIKYKIQNVENKESLD